MRRQALRTLTEKAREFGAAALFNEILPLMMQSTLEDQVRGPPFPPPARPRGFVAEIAFAFCGAMAMAAVACRKGICW